MMEKIFRGVSAAVLTPRLADGEINAPALRKLLEFLLKKGIRSFALNGATGEYCLTTDGQLRTLLCVANEVAAGGAEFLCGVGAANTTQSIAFAQIALEANVKGLLLPMPYFFPYQQGDLEQFCRSLAAAVSIPVLLYNLPLFTTALHKETVGTLISEVPNIVGIKDSSGSLDIFHYLTNRGLEACRIVGDDSVFGAALRAEICDGVVSGVACVAPELMLALYGVWEQSSSAEFTRLAHAVDELIAQLSIFPIPWGLKWIAQARGILEPQFPLPLSEQRKEQGKQMALWFPSWWSGLEL